MCCSCICADVPVLAKRSMGQFNFTSLLRRSAAVRIATRGVTLVVLAVTLVGVAAYIQTHITTDSLAVTTTVIAVLVILEAALFIVVERIFKNI